MKKLIFLAALLGSYVQCAPKNPKSIEESLKKGLHIDNGINRGTNYTDSLGTDYNLRYIPIIITNDNIIPIHILVDFSKDYNYPMVNENGTDQFKVFPVPKEWALDGIAITDSLRNELTSYINKPILERTIEPGKKFLFGIGTLYSRPPRFSGVLPNILFVPMENGMFPNCEWLMEDNQSTQPKTDLGLKLDFGDRCMIIPCGQISYTE